MPQDGVVPGSSYSTLYLYMDSTTFYRDALLAMSGEDIFDAPQFPKIIDYLWSVVRQDDLCFHSADATMAPPQPFLGANAFLNAMAAKLHSPKAAILRDLALKAEKESFYHGCETLGYYHGLFWGAMGYQPAVPGPNPEPPPPLTFFPDTGLAHFHDRRDDVTLSVKCGAPSSHSAHRKAQGPCDRLLYSVGVGHFVLASGAHAVLNSPDTGYRLTAAQRSCLLIDGSGPHGDVGYPMSIPSWRHRGEEALFARWDEAREEGWIRLDLRPAYQDGLGMLRYHRDFILSPRLRQVVCRDQVVFSKPHRLSWLFQLGNDVAAMELGGGTFALAEFRLVPVGELKLDASIRDTPVVWSYASASGFKPFKHVRYDSADETDAACVDFTFNWVDKDAKP